jgi:hypothetical protein
MASSPEPTTVAEEVLVMTPKERLLLPVKALKSSSTKTSKPASPKEGHDVDTEMGEEPTTPVRKPKSANKKRKQGKPPCKSLTWFS